MKKEEFKQLLDERDDKFKIVLSQALSDQSRDFKDYVDSAERRLSNKIDQKVDQSENRVLQAISDSFDLLTKPRIDDHERRIVRLEKKFA